MESPTAIGKKTLSLVEIFIVISILAVFLNLSIPMAGETIKKSRENLLKNNLVRTRECIDRFFGDYSRYPENLSELVEKNYLRGLPYDPFTKSFENWKVISSEGGKNDLFDLKSSSQDKALNGSSLSDW